MSVLTDGLSSVMIHPAMIDVITVFLQFLRWCKHTLTSITTVLYQTLIYMGRVARSGQSTLVSTHSGGTTRTGLGTLCLLKNSSPLRDGAICIDFRHSFPLCQLSLSLLPYFLRSCTTLSPSHMHVMDILRLKDLLVPFETQRHRPVDWGKTAQCP